MGERTMSRSDTEHATWIACISCGSPRTSASTEWLVRLAMRTRSTRRPVSSVMSPRTSSHGQVPRSSRRKRGRARKNCTTELKRARSSSCPTSAKRKASRCGRNMCVGEFDTKADPVLALAPGFGSKWSAPKMAVAAADWSSVP